MFFFEGEMPLVKLGYGVRINNLGEGIPYKRKNETQKNGFRINEL